MGAITTDSAADKGTGKDVGASSGAGKCSDKDANRRAGAGDRKVIGKRERVRGGAAKWALPIVAACIGMLMASLLMMPMLKMEPRDVPVGILTLDEGVVVGDVGINVGDLLASKLTGEDFSNAGAEVDGESDGGAFDGDAASSDEGSASSEGNLSSSSDLIDALEDSALFGGSDEDAEGEGGSSSGYVTSDAVRWIVADSAEELDALFSSGECYAVMTIPAGFSQYVIANAGSSALGAQLVERLPDLSDGATALNEGTSSLIDGVDTLSSGASGLSSGAAALESGVESIPSAADAAASGAAALSEGLSKLADGAGSLEDGAISLKGGTDSVDRAISAALGSLMSSSPDVQEAIRYLTLASEGTQALGEGAEKLADGASGLSSGLAASKQGADALGEGMGKLSDGADKLVEGAGALASGASKLEQGASSLASGAGALHDGTGSLADGLSSANDVLGELPESEDASLAISLVINQGKNPMVSNSLGSAISSMASSSGLSFDISYENPLPEGMSMGFTHMILMIFTYISSYATAVVLANTFKLDGGERKGRGRVLGGVGVQVGYAAICALAIGLCAASIISWATGAQISFCSLALFVALCSFAFQLLVLGSLDLFGMAGMIVPIGLLVIGMGTAYLPTEFLPAFWQDWVYPWDPLRFMADGFRGILYMGQGAWNASSPALCVLACIGLALILAKAASCLSRKAEGIAEL